VLEPGADGLRLLNRQQERDLSWLRVASARLVIGDAVHPIEVKLPALGPGQGAPLELTVPDGGPEEAWVVLELETALDQSWAPAGTSIGHAQHQLRAEQRPLLTRANVTVGSTRGESPPLLDDSGSVRHHLLAGAPRLCLWRAPTDNDRMGGFADRWDRWGLRDLSRELNEVITDETGSLVRSTYRTGSGPAVQHELRIRTVQGEIGSGLLVEETATVPDELTDLPRVGTVFEVVAGLEQVSWLGPGPQESYPDRRAAGALGRHTSDVTGLRTRYLRPQESGGRFGVRRFSLSGAAGRMEVVLDEPRQVSWAHHTAQDLDAATHDHEVPVRPQTVVHLDAAHRGLGTASCGPDTLAEYRFGPGTYTWSWVLLAPDPG
jgi:beta-galactosidase